MHDELPFQLYSAQQVRDLDAQLIAGGLPGLELMRRAAAAAWRSLRHGWPHAGALCVLAGGGNNAGDGYLVAALARKAGWQARVWHLADPTGLQGDAALAHAEALAAGVDIQPWRTDAPLEGLVVDALLGTGLKGAAREPYAAAIERINASELPVVAIDLPSGLDADTGAAAGPLVRADLTITFIGLKLGLFTGKGPDHVGSLVFEPLMEEPQNPAHATAQRLAPGNLPRLARRPLNAHKGQYGHLLVIGGDEGTGGAAIMTSEAALRCGAGMLSLATRPSNVTAVLARRPEVMVAGVHSSFAVLELAKKADVLAVGPGLGQGAWGKALASAAATLDAVQVWDADALNLLAAGVVQAPRGPWVMTPHPGEAARLLEVSIKDIEADRPGSARELARRYGGVALLKGFGTLIAHPDGRMALCGEGHPAMATGGLGDILTGIIAALLGQGLAPFEAACLGAWLHGRAGAELGRQGRGLAASDLPPVARQLLEELQPCLN